MTCAPVEIAEQLARRLEGIEQSRTGLPLEAARAALARRIGLPVGTLETLRRGRRKSLSDALRERLARAVVIELEREIGALTNELEMARALRRPDRADLGEIAEIEADLSALRARLSSVAGR